MKSKDEGGRMRDEEKRAPSFHPSSLLLGGRLLCRSAHNAVIDRKTERNLHNIEDLAHLSQTIQRRVIRTGNQSSAYYADQSNYC